MIGEFTPNIQPPEPVTIGTRFWANSSTDLARLHVFLTAAEQSGEQTIVAINEKQDVCNTPAFIDSLAMPTVHHVEIPEWGFKVPLERLFKESLASGHNRMLVASVEFPPSVEHIRHLSQFAKPGVVAIGAVLEGHDFHPGTIIQAASARQMPWNTYALIDTAKVMSTGIPKIVDGGENSKMAGMEEAVTLASQQLIGNTSSLVQVPGIHGWTNTQNWTLERQKAHEDKIQSKDIRATYQLAQLGLVPPSVRHE